MTANNNEYETDYEIQYTTDLRDRIPPPLLAQEDPTVHYRRHVENTGHRKKLTEMRSISQKSVVDTVLYCRSRWGFW